MRLINTNTMSAEEFVGQTPPYGILSHTWGAEEVVLKDLPHTYSRHMMGFKKVKMVCQLAKAEGLEYAWIDTCCIDKRSSAELTEAINSMFRWYKRAAKCYVYLEDLSPQAPWSDLRHCRWFTRGWTLQELIAPNSIDFYDQEWNFRSTKSAAISVLSNITGIIPSVLQENRPLSTIPVAQRMSWAARRQTTRVEDVAYSLLGIFNINMPLLYGEEERAFLRLQEEIIRTSLDLSIFAWRLPSSPEVNATQEYPVYSGVLAQSPLGFQDSGSLIPFQSQMSTKFAASNRGITLDARCLFEPRPGKLGKDCILILCSSQEDEASVLWGIYLKAYGPNCFARVNPYEFAHLDISSWTMIWRHVDRNLLPQLPEMKLGLSRPSIRGLDFILENRIHALQLLLPHGTSINEQHSEISPSNIWDDDGQLFFLTSDPNPDGAVVMIGTIATLSIPTAQGTSKAEINCYIFVLGWGKLERTPQFTLLDPGREKLSLDKLGSRFGLYDYRSSAPLREDLCFYGIPQTPYAIYHLEEVGLSIIVSCSCQKTVDPSLCQNPFWRLELSYKVISGPEVPHELEIPWK